MNEHVLPAELMKAVQRGITIALNEELRKRKWLPVSAVTQWQQKMFEEIKKAPCTLKNEKNVCAHTLERGLVRKIDVLEVLGVKP